MPEGVTYRSQVFLLHTTRAQENYFAQAVGVSRFAYNWALDQWKAQAIAWWETNGATPFPTVFSLQKQFNAIKRDQWPWIDNVAQLIPERAIASVGIAYDRYKKGLSRYPKFKAKRRAKPNFFAAVRKVEARIKGTSLKLPKIGRVKLSRAPRWTGDIQKIVISKRAGKWYAIISFSLPEQQNTARPNVAAGVDVGVKCPLKVTCSGRTYEFGVGLSERINVERRKLKRADRKMRRRMPGSKRRERATLAVQRLQKRIADIRSDVQHKATSQIANLADVIGIENLNVRGLLRNRAVSRAISDIGFRAIREQLTYKASAIVVADRFFPSTKRCSCCGALRERVGLWERQYTCGSCNLSIDRDENAARNLENLAADEAVSLRGERSSAPGRKPRLRSLSVKREPDHSGSFK